MKSSSLAFQKKIFFRKFTRKKFAVFFSLRKVIHISNLIVVYTIIASSSKVRAQTDTTQILKKLDIEEVEVIAPNYSTVSDELSKFVAVSILSETECVPSQSISDLLRFAGNIDIRQRGKNGIQSDVSIRGGSFDHSLILLNGINITDPQTGHLSLNLPVETEVIKQVEILNGTASRIYGTNAFSGAVNILVTPPDTNFLTLTSSLGEYSYFSGSVSLGIVTKGVKNLLHFNNAYSSGYTYNTDFRKQSVYYNGEVGNTTNRMNIQFAITNRAFGANSYYTPRFPEQFESNKMYLLAFDYTTGKQTILNTRVYWRRHIDRFELFREDQKYYKIEDSITVSNNPEITQYDTVSWYRNHNHHINDVFGFQIELERKTGIGLSSLGWHIRSENIISNNIGYDKGIVIPVRGYEGTFYTLSDNRSNIDMYIEQTAEFYPLYITGGLLLNWNSYLPDELPVFPGIDCRLYLLTHTYLFTSYNYAQGLPTFTDLTYEDPDNEGNNELKPYSQHSLSGGIRYLNHKINITLNCFYQIGHNVIDWVWFEDNFRFSPINAKKYNSQGIEFTGIFDAAKIPYLNLMLDNIRLNYTFIDMHKEIPGNVSKFFNVRHKFSAMLEKNIMQSLTVACNIGYIAREGYYLTYDFVEGVYQKNKFVPYWLTDLRLSYYLKGFTFYAEATNLFDRHYIDVGSIYQPGHWITCGIKYKIKGF